MAIAQKSKETRVGMKDGNVGLHIVVGSSRLDNRLQQLLLGLSGGTRISLSY